MTQPLGCRPANFSPLVDLRCVGDSYATGAEVDRERLCGRNRPLR